METLYAISVLRIRLRLSDYAAASIQVKSLRKLLVGSRLFSAFGKGYVV
jgi:hypothetical protein